jgi:hypothetical protein
MSILMSAAITAINTGLEGGFVARWGHAWMFAWPLATLSAYVARPLALRLSDLTVKLLSKVG